MILEQLVFRVEPGVLKDWLAFEDEHWLPWLRQQPGFVQKQIDLGPGLATNKIWWQSKELWDQAAAKRNEINRLDILMNQRFGSRVIRLNAL